MVDLIALPYSPWSEKARWALDYHQLTYDEKLYTPLFGALPLRWRTRRWRGTIRVPVLVNDSSIVFDSFQIAQWADRRGSRPRLIPANQASEIESWNTDAERALHAGRALLIHHIASDKQAQQDYVPGFIPKFLRPLLGPSIASMGLAMFRHKYRLAEKPMAEHHATLQAVVARLAATITPERETILPSFSFADIAMAAVLQFVRPVDSPYIRLSPRSRHCWANEDIAATYPTTITWRDNLYNHYRQPG